MQQVLILLLIAVAACSSGGSLDSLEKQSCDTVFCALGKECVMKNKHPGCECIEKCHGPHSPVCGSDGVNSTTYKSECHLFKAGCENENITITLVAEMSCEKVTKEDLKVSKDIEKDEKKIKPVVCMEKDRDGLRLRIIKWISIKSNFDVNTISYKALLLKYFLSLDTDNDKALDTVEFMKLIDGDDSMMEVLSQDEPTNPILRGLCATELISITDKNSDYKLEFEEFHKCLDPEFQPPKEKCDLGGVQFKDGEDVPANCDNTCKCACGHWVCTHSPCAAQGSNDSNSAEDKLAEVGHHH